MTELTPSNGSRFLLISIISAVLGCVADILLLYEPNAVYENGDYAFLLNIHQHRIYIGSILGVLTIPVYLCGIYVVIFKIIEGKTIAFVSFMCTVFIAVIGCVYHASIPMVAYILRKSADPLQEIESIRMYFDIYAAGLTLTFFLFCSIFLLVMVGKQQWRFVLFNPIITYSLCIASYLLFPAIGRILLPAGFNLSVAILLCVAYGSPALGVKAKNT